MAAVDATTRTGSVRLRLDVSNVQSQRLLSAAGARRYAYNWALARIVANHAQWQAEATYGIEKRDRIKPFTFFDLVKQWDAGKHEHTPWFAEHSTWTFRYAHPGRSPGAHRLPDRQSEVPAVQVPAP